MLPVFENLSYKKDYLMCCPSNKFIKTKTYNNFSSYNNGGLDEDKLFDALQAISTTNIKTVY